MCFTLLVAGAGVLIALDKENAQLYVGVIALLSVMSAVIVLPYSRETRPTTRCERPIRGR